jgi:hypothetical protein
MLSLWARSCESLSLQPWWIHLVHPNVHLALADCTEFAAPELGFGKSLYERVMQRPRIIRQGNSSPE